MGYDDWLVVSLTIMNEQTNQCSTKAVSSKNVNQEQLAVLSDDLCSVL